jgi:hypothetical protein
VSQSSHTSGRLQDKCCRARKCPSVENPSKDIVESGKDDVGYKLNNSYQSATGAEQNKTEDRGASNNQILGYEDRLDWEVEFDAQVGTKVVGTSSGLPCSNFSNSLKILENHNEWPSGSARFFYEGSPNSWEWIKRFGLQFCHGL